MPKRLIRRGKMWYSNIIIDGTQVRRPLSIYLPEARDRVEEMVQMRNAKKYGESPKNLSWKFFSEEYLRRSKVNKELKTFSADSRAFGIINEVALLNKLQEMTPERLEHIQVLLKEKKYKPAAIARAIRAIKTAMRRAEDLKYLPPQNWRLVKTEEPAGRMDFFEVKSYRNLLLSLEGVFLTAAWLMGRAGLRLGEALHLEWPDVQFSNRRIIFRSKPQFGWRIKGDRKLKKVRTIPMAQDLQLYLQSIAKPRGFVLDEEYSRPVNQFSERMKRAMTQTGVLTYLGEKGFPHILRHTFGSHLAQAGVSDKKIADLLGHKSVRMAEIYSHFRQEDINEGILSLEKFVPNLYLDRKQLKTGTTNLEQNNAQSSNGDLPSESNEKHL